MRFKTNIITNITFFTSILFVFHYITASGAFLIFMLVYGGYVPYSINTALTFMSYLSIVMGFIIAGVAGYRFLGKKKGVLIGVIIEVLVYFYFYAQGKWWNPFS